MTTTIQNFARQLETMIAEEQNYRPETNDAELQNTLYNHYLGKIFSDIGKRLKDTATKEMKLRYDDLLAKVKDYGQVDCSGPVDLQLKVEAPRKNFDREQFIMQVAKNYKISVTELNSLANKTVKETSNIAKFSTTLVD